jgi:pentatricopeptide repeat domain-containing protein 1
MLGGEWRAALRLLDVMDTDGCPPELVSYNAAINACGRGRAWEPALQVHACTYFYVYELLVTTIAVATDKVLCILKRAVARFFESDGYHMLQCSQAAVSHALLQLYVCVSQPPNINAESHCCITARVRRLLQRLSCSRCYTPCSTTTTLTMLLKQQLLEGVRRRGLQPNAVTYSAAITACDRSKKWREALVLLEMMRKDGVSPTQVTYSAAIHACAGGGLVGKAMQLLDEMRAAGTHSNSSSIYYYTVVLYVVQ